MDCTTGSSNDHGSTRGRLRRAGTVGAATTLAGGSAMALLTALAAPASSTTFTVTEATDDGTGNVVGSLSWAIAQAESDEAPDVIDFAPTLTTITFTGDADQVPIVYSLDIVGPGADALTIDLNSNCGFVANLYYTADLSISGVTITGGNTDTLYCDSRGDRSGGALALYDGGTYATFTLSDVVVSGNSAYYYGGGIACHGSVSVTIENSTFDSNSAGSDGGGVYLDCEYDVTITGSVFSGNTAGGDGGGIDLGVRTGTVASIISSTFSDNVAGSWGGGIHAENGTVVIRNTTVSGNVANRGGGIGGDTYLQLTQSTITENSAYKGGGMFWRQGRFGGDAASSFDITFSTISGNTAQAGNEMTIDRINNYGQVSSIVGSIIAGTAGGDSIYFYGSTPVSLFPVYVYGSALGTAVDSNFYDEGHNQFDLADPVLEALADNGGPTQTMMPATGSPVIDAGPPSFAPFPGDEFDQRGTPFVRIHNGQVDIGAVESQPTPEPTTTTTSTTSTSTTSTIAPPTTSPDTSGGSDPVTPEFTG